MFADNERNGMLLVSSRHGDEAGSAKLRVALVTCSQLRGLDEDTQRVIGPLAARGVWAFPAVWDDPTVDWARVDLAVVRSCWDYPARRTEFLAWANRIQRLANPSDVLAWNTDKRYLLDLATAVPIVPTTWVEPHHTWTPPREGEWVVKPSVSLASLDTGRYRLTDFLERELAVAHIRRLQLEGRTVMVQPYFHGVDDEGETSLVFIGGEFSHAMRKAAVLDGPDGGLDRRFLPFDGPGLRRQDPTPTELAVAQRALAAVPGGPERLLYARVDLVPGADGRPVLMELELTEPQLYFSHVVGAAERFATAAARAASSAQERFGDYSSTGLVSR
jgi:hypothetical protein